VAALVGRCWANLGREVGCEAGLRAIWLAALLGRVTG
jgi:hypothetical protein